MFFTRELDLMKTHFAVAMGFALLLGTSVALADKAAKPVKADTVKSGPQAGEELAGPFHPLNVNGKQAGKKACLYCSNGDKPVAMIFAREPSANLTKLIKKLDGCCDKNKDCKMGSFVVFLNDDEKLEGKLKKVAKDADLKNVVLSIDNPAGPKGYKVSKDADITVVLYVDRTAKVNHTFKKGELKDANIDTIVKDLKKILPEKK
jgi:hypothetical protein